MGFEQKKVEFKQKVFSWAGRLDVQVRLITIRPLRNKWASCSTAGRLTFDSALVDMEDKLQDYVIVHELLHFRVPNHGKLWKSLMTAYLGDYEESREELEKSAGIPHENGVA